MALLGGSGDAFLPRVWCTLPLFRPYRSLLAGFADDVAWPAPETWQARLGTTVAFRPQHEKMGAGVDADDVDGSYPDRCARGVVPSRAENLHDFMNALVWARFPRAKAALADALVASCRARPRDPKNRNRNRIQDRFAMIDEGGLVGVHVDGKDGSGKDGSGKDVDRIAFGHALLEDSVRGVASRGFVVDVGVANATDVDVDGALAAWLAAQPLTAPAEQKGPRVP